MGVEACWVLFTPKSANRKQQKVFKICVASVCVSPKSRNKVEAISHIIDTIHYINSLEQNVKYVVAGDMNHLPLEPIIDSYGALKSLVEVPTRKDSILEVILSDLHPFYHPPVTMKPLQVDKDKVGKDSDHDIVIMAPKSNVLFSAVRGKKVIKTRPLPASKIREFGCEITQKSWDVLFEKHDINHKTEYFHAYITALLNKHFPQKSSKI